MQDRIYHSAIQSGLAGNYSFAPVETIRESFAATEGFKGTVWIAMGIIVTINIILGVIQAIIPQSRGSQAVYQLLVMFITQPMQAGLMMLGVLYMAGIAVKGNSVLDYFDRTVKIVFLTILTALGITLGLICLILPGIYLMIAWSMAMPLMLKYDLRLWEALKVSRKAVTHQWWSFFGTFILMAIVIIISALPLGIGLIWTIPMCICLYGKLFNTVFQEGAESYTQVL